MRAMGVGTHHWVRNGEREEENLSETLQRRLHRWKRKEENGVKGRGRQGFKVWV